jgi:SAM-dependent methyltransferase
MSFGFPVKLISDVQCPRDYGELGYVGSLPMDQVVTEGYARCSRCGMNYKIAGGILEVIDEQAIANVSRSEMEIRDAMLQRPSIVVNREDPIFSRIEWQATMEAFGELTGKSILELGCGTGKYTRDLAASADSVLAIDLSLPSLRIAATSLAGRRNVGLVRADVGKLRINNERFDLALSTLHSNLPTEEIRIFSVRTAWDSLRQNGKYVLSVHRHDIRKILRGEASECRYANGIFYKTFTKRTLRLEIGKIVGEMDVKPVCVMIPLLSRLRYLRPYISIVSEYIPGVNAFSLLLLVTATKGRGV